MPGLHEWERRVVLDYANSVEDCLAGLLINGVSIGEIEVRHYADRVLILVRGIPRYEITVKITGPTTAEL